MRCCQFTTAIALLEQMNNGVRVSGVGATQRVTAITRVLPPPTFAQLRTKSSVPHQYFVHDHFEYMFFVSSSNHSITSRPAAHEPCGRIKTCSRCHIHAKRTTRPGTIHRNGFVRDDGPWTCQFRVARCSGASQKHTEHMSRAAVGQQCKPCGFIGQGWRLTRHGILVSAR